MNEVWCKSPKNTEYFCALNWLFSLNNNKIPDFILYTHHLPFILNMLLFEMSFSLDDSKQSRTQHVPIEGKISDYARTICRHCRRPPRSRSHKHFIGEVKKCFFFFFFFLLMPFILLFFQFVWDKNDAVIVINGNCNNRFCNSFDYILCFNFPSKCINQSESAMMENMLRATWALKHAAQFSSLTSIYVNNFHNRCTNIIYCTLYAWQVG